MQSPVVQNDERLAERPRIGPTGCLFRSLSYLIETVAEQTLEPEQIISLYDHLTKQFEKDQYRGMDVDCFVMRHEDVLDATAAELEVKVDTFYIEKESYSTRVKPWKSAYEVEPTHFILHSAVNDNWIGHFMVSDEDKNRAWDPYFPATELKTPRSFRTYAIIRR